MMKSSKTIAKFSMRSIPVIALCTMVIFGSSMDVKADEEDAKRILKAMSAYVSAQQALSFEYDASLEIVTTDEQTLALASSGAVTLQRPDKLRFIRSSGFVDFEMIFDGNTLTLMGNNMNAYAAVDVPGTIDNLFDELRVTYDRPVPAADLVSLDSYDELIRDVVDIKDLGSGVIGGVECDSLAFRTEEVDWQIWIAQGEAPYPCRYVITSKHVTGGPQFTIQIRDWKAGDEVEATEFVFKNSTNAKKVDMKDLKDSGALPAHFTMGDSE